MLDTQTELPDDCCECGREASEAEGDTLLDHEPTCEVYLQEVKKRNRLMKQETYKVVNGWDGEDVAEILNLPVNQGYVVIGFTSYVVDDSVWFSVLLKRA